MINKIMIVGAGTMGLDIAQTFAMSGFEVVVRDVNEDAISKAKVRLANNLNKLLNKDKISISQRDNAYDRVTFTTDIAVAADCDLVVEAIVENLEIKKAVFAELDKICKEDTIFASNTSSISITAMAVATSRPDKVIGMHFFNPATIMALVEIISGKETSEETLQIIKGLAIKIGKEPIVVTESPGFVLNRILIPMINEAVSVLDSNIASAEDIDKAMQLGANHRVGPLHLGDMIGLDVCLSIMETIYHETGDDKYAPAKLLRKMVRAGRLGVKTGIGFFEYNK